ncbi:Far upstream element-binding protein 3 [Durusdinium trenchii]|uniref:Far upstream element-binding protein 3 n=2 Tax=Durusdinium trenchii TaxID=1381693 RepID=A0ABP0PP05_9DINO
MPYPTMPSMLNAASMLNAPSMQSRVPSMQSAPSSKPSNIFRAPGSMLIPEAAPMIPTLHSVLTGEVQMLTPRGALLRLSDQSQVRYLDGLLRRRPEEPAKSVGAKCFVKVVRIEAGMVIVETKDVDQEVGKDLDPEHEKAEIEEWLDVPMRLVGRVIGRKGETIRKICEESGADLRFDETVREELGGNTKRKTTGGTGDDMRKFLEAAQEDAELTAKMEEEPQDETAEPADDLRAFLAEAQADAPRAAEIENEEEGEVQEAAGDLAAFLRAAKADEAEQADLSQLPARSFVPAVEFIAYSLENWDELLYRKMGDAGVSLVYPENLSITDKEGQAVDIEKGLRQKHFPIRVRYILTSDTYVKDLKPQEEAKKEDAEVKVKEEEAPEERKNTKPAKASVNRKDAIYVSGLEGLSKKQVFEVFKSKSLPLPLTVDRVSSSDSICVFADVQDAQTAMGAMEAHGHGVQVRLATMAEIRQKAFNRFKEVPKEEFMRLRINGDSPDVRTAKKLVLDLLDELSSSKSGAAARERRGEDGSVEESLAVPVGRIGHLIGKGGKNIQDLEKLTGARLRVLPAANDEEDEQRLLVSGTPKAVDLAKKHLRKYIPTLPDEVTASGVPERRKTETAAEPPAEPSPGESLRGRRAQAAEVLEAAGRARNSLKEVARSRSSSTSSRTRVKRLRERKKGISLEEYQVMLRKQKELDAAAAKAEEMAESARAFARRVAEEDRQREEVEDSFDWVEESGPSALGRLCVTSCGAGRVSRVVVTPSNRRYISFELLAGGVLQVPEDAALPWLRAVEGSLGSRVSAPAEWTEGSSRPPSGAVWVVSELLPQGRRLAFRLVTPAELFPRFVEAGRLPAWPRLESVVYLVELSTTPETVGHIMPYRHDYRKSEKSYAKGDLLLLEGSRPGLQDVGIVRKVLYGAKGEKAAMIAAQKDPLNLSGTPRLALQRCGAAEKIKREQITALERMVLPLLASRLPTGATALGVGASLDGTFLRFFVRLPPSTEAKGADQESPAAQGAAAAAAAVGALLGCLSEVFASFGAEPLPQPKEVTTKEVQEKRKKARDKVLKAARKKAKEKKASSKSSSSSSSSSDEFLLAMAKRGDKALARVAQAEERAEKAAQAAIQ